MAFNISYKFTAIDEFSGVGRKIARTTEMMSKKISSLSGHIETAGRRLVSFGKRAMASGGFFSTAAIMGSVYSYDKLIKAQTLLKTAVVGNIKPLLEYADALEKTTRFSHTQILQAMQAVAPFVKSAKATKMVTQAILDLAVGQGLSLTASALMVGKTLGSTTNALTRYGVAVTGAVGSTQRLSTTIQGTERIYKGLAQAAAKVGAGPLINMKNRLEGVSEVLGKLFLPELNKIVYGIDSLITSFNSLSAGSKKLISILAILAAAVPALMVTFGTLGIIIGGIGAAVDLIFSPITLIVGAVMALGAAFMYLWHKSAFFRGIVIENVRTFKAFYGAIWKVVSLVKYLPSLFEGAFKILRKEIEVAIWPMMKIYDLMKKIAGVSKSFSLTHVASGAAHSVLGAMMSPFEDFYKSVSAVGDKYGSTSSATRSNTVTQHALKGNADVNILLKDPGKMVQSSSYASEGFVNLNLGHNMAY